MPSRYMIGLIMQSIYVHMLGFRTPSIYIDSSVSIYKC